MGAPSRRVLNDLCLLSCPPHSRCNEEPGLHVPLPGCGPPVGPASSLYCSPFLPRASVQTFTRPSTFTPHLPCPHLHVQIPLASEAQLNVLLPKKTLQPPHTHLPPQSTTHTQGAINSTPPARGAGPCVNQVHCQTSRGTRFLLLALKLF